MQKLYWKIKWHVFMAHGVDCSHGEQDYLWRSGYDETDTRNVAQVWDAIHGNPPTREGFTIFPVVLHPRSKGNIRLRSNNPDDPPFINPNYLSEEIDVKILAEGTVTWLPAVYRLNTLIRRREPNDCERNQLKIVEVTSLFVVMIMMTEIIQQLIWV